MLPPDAKEHHTSPKRSAEYLRKLLEIAKLTQVEAATLLGIDPRTMRRYLGARAQVPPYTVQYALEALAEFRVALGAAVRVAVRESAAPGARQRPRAR